MSSTTVKGRRALFLVHRLNLSGVSRQNMLLATGLQARGWEIAVATRDLQRGTSMGVEWFEAAGVLVFEAPFPVYGLTVHNAASALRTIVALHRIVEEFRPDIIHVHAPTLCPYAGIIGWAHWVPTVSTLHIESLGPNKLRLARLGTRWFSKAFGDLSIAISGDMSRVLIDSLGISPDRVRTIVHGVDEEHFRPPTADERARARQAFQLADSQPVACLIAVLEERKGHNLLIRALAALRRRGLDVVALCAGTGEAADIDRVRRHAREAGVGDLVHLLGYQDSRQVMWASDASLLLSSREGFGLAIVESMLCGLVPLRTPAAGASDQIIDGQTGFIIPFNDDAILADRLFRLFNDPTTRTRLGSAARQFALGRFTGNVMAQTTEAVYEEAIDRFIPRFVPFT